MKETILIIEDEEKLARFLELELRHEGYEVVKAFDGRSGLEQLRRDAFSLVLLDVQLPELDGLEVLRRARQEGYALPVLMLTARDTVADKVSGLDFGANDYLTKPFAIEELLARIRALLRGAVPARDGTLHVGTLALCPERRTVTVGDAPIDLTKREFDLLHCLMESKNIVLDRDTLLNRVWDFDFDGGTNAVDVYIRYLRAKLEEPYGLKFIHTVRGVGYVIKE